MKSHYTPYKDDLMQICYQLYQLRKRHKITPEIQEVITELFQDVSYTRLNLYSQTFAQDYIDKRLGVSK